MIYFCLNLLRAQIVLVDLHAYKCHHCYNGKMEPLLLRVENDVKVLEAEKGDHSYCDGRFNLIAVIMIALLLKQIILGFVLVNRAAARTLLVHHLVLLL